MKNTSKIIATSFATVLSISVSHFALAANDTEIASAKAAEMARVAVAACEGKNEGDKVAFANVNEPNTQIDAVCQKSGDVLVAQPIQSQPNAGQAAQGTALEASPPLSPSAEPQQNAPAVAPPVSQ